MPRNARRPKGSALICVGCGETFAYASGPQVRCTSCQATHNRAATISANKRSPRRAEHRKNNKLHRAFGGNRDAARARDGEACRKCGSTTSLHVHHIDGKGKGVPVAERNHALGNLVTLCTTCHRRIHVETEKALFAAHPDTVQRVFRAFIGHDG